MRPIQSDVDEFRAHLKKGTIQKAYRALLSYMMGLRTHFESRYPDAAVSALYQGSMDFTYFAISPPRLKERNLKIAIVFDYDSFHFEAWLAGRNKDISQNYWKVFKGNGWTKHRLVVPGKGIGGFVQCELAKDFVISDPRALTSTIEKATGAFITDVEKFLSKHLPASQE